MEVWYFDYLDNFPSALFSSSASLSPLLVMTSNSVLYLRMGKRVSLKKRKGKRKSECYCTFCVFIVFYPQSETGLRHLDLNNWKVS